jgi:zinc protease
MIRWIPKTLAACGSALLLLGITTASDAQQPLPRLAVQTYTLPNGLSVILHEDHTSPVVAVDVWYHVGSKDEPAHRNGFAHLFEHLMFQGSKHVAEDHFFYYLELAGASARNGTTSTDRTNYFETVPSNQLDLALWLESDRMAFLLDHADQKTFEEQRKVVKNERRQHYEDAPYGLVPKFVHEALYPADHPYHNLTIGSYEDLDRATLQDVQAFFKTFYLPNNASLVVSGDVQPQAARQAIDKYFGPIARGAQPKVITQAAPVALQGEQLLHVAARVELPRVYIAYPTPALYQPGDAALDALASILSQGKSSRLYKRLVYDLQIAKDVNAYQASAQLGSMFEILATAQKGHTPDELLKAIDEELGKLRAQAPTNVELDRAKAEFESTLIFRIERMGERADMFNAYAQIAGDPNYFARDVGRYRALMPADLQKAAQAWLPEHKRVIAVVNTDPQAPVCGELKGGR